MPTRSAAPLIVGFGVAVIALGGAFGPWFAITGLVPCPDRRRGLAPGREPGAGPAVRGGRGRPARSVAAPPDIVAATRAPWVDEPHRSRRADPWRASRARVRAGSSSGRGRARSRWPSPTSSGPASAIVAVDQDRRALETMRGTVADRFPEATASRPGSADFTQACPPARSTASSPPTASTSSRQPDAVLAAIRDALVPGGRFVLVEYDADHGNPWVPHPISFETLAAHRAGRRASRTRRLIHRVPSRFLNAIYGAVTERRGAGARWDRTAPSRSPGSRPRPTHAPSGS